MATKSYSKHKEYKEFSSSSSKNAPPPYTDEQFDMIKSELIPKGSKLNSLDRSGTGSREYHYEYKEEKHPSGKYDRKDLRTVEEFTIPPKTTPKSSESSSYYYTREERELPSITSGGSRTYNYETSLNSTPGYSKVKSSKATKELSHNVEELDSLLDDLQKDQERQLYKSGYTSDTAESSSFDYKRGTPVKAPSSGYSTMKREERVEESSWNSSPAPITRAAELRQEMYREEKTESRVVPSQISPVLPLAVPPTVCANCHQPPTGTLPRGTPMNKVTTTVKTYTYEVPADRDPTSVPLPPLADHQHTYVSTTEKENIVTSSNQVLQPAPVPVQVPVPVATTGCAHCSHCNTRIREYSQLTTTDELQRSEHMVYPAPANQTHSIHPTHPTKSPSPAPATQPQPPLNGHGPYGPTSYKYTETSYTAQNSTERFPSPPPTTTTRHLTPSPSPFPRPSTPSPGTQQPPKKLDDLLADFPEARFPTQPDGVIRRKVEVHESNSHSSMKEKEKEKEKETSKSGPVVGTQNVTGPAVYYPPGHTPFAKKDVAPASGYYAASAAQGGGAHASGRGMYEYESGARSKEKHSERTTAVPVCLPLCCAMPCVIL